MLSGSQFAAPKGLLDRTVHGSVSASPVHRFPLAVGHPEAGAPPFEPQPPLGAALRGATAPLFDLAAPKGLGAARLCECAYLPTGIPGLEFSGLPSNLRTVIAGPPQPPWSCLEVDRRHNRVLRLGTSVRGSIVVMSPVSGWLEPVLDKLQFLIDLEEWKGDHHSLRLSPEAVQLMLMFLSRTMRPGTAVPSIVPIGDGGIQIEWHRAGLDVEVEFIPGEPVEAYVHELSSEETHEANADLLFEELDLARRLLAH